LEDTGLKVGDLVLYTSVKDSTGGVIFQIVENTEPVVPHTTERTVRVNRQRYDNASHNYVYVNCEEVQRGLWDKNGKKIMKSAVHGFVRIKPIFDFFATNKGKAPIGKNNTIIIHYEHIRDVLVPVDLVLLGTKYVELGNIIRDIARRNGMDDDQG
jgi:hypothetical protein